MLKLEINILAPGIEEVDNKVIWVTGSLESYTMVLTMLTVLHTRKTDYIFPWQDSFNWYGDPTSPCRLGYFALGCQKCGSFEFLIS